MKYKKVCEYCELYGACLYYGKQIKPNDTCDGWELAFSIFQDLSPKEQNKAIKEMQKSRG